MVHILLVEDAPEVRMSVREILLTAGHTVEEANTGQQALDQLKRQSFDLIVTDVWMPEMDGIRFLQIMRGAGDETPVIVVSGGAPNAPLTYTAPLATTFGANFVLYKPFESTELITAITSLMSS